MNKYQKQVRAFHKALGLPAPDKLTMLNPQQLKRRVALILEEAVEFARAAGFDAHVHYALDSVREGVLTPLRLPINLAAMVDALCDIHYVTAGTAVELGLDLEPYFDAVHESNLQKRGGELRADGKLLKPEGWKPPPIAEMLQCELQNKMPRTIFDSDEEERWEKRLQLLEARAALIRRVIAGELDAALSKL